jgi:hypothetical protein
MVPCRLLLLLLLSQGMVRMACTGRMKRSKAQFGFAGQLAGLQSCCDVPPKLG